VLLTFDPGSARFFSEAWSSDAVDKRYLAITRGHPALHQVLDHAIPKAPGEARVDAVTEIWRRETFGRYALVEASPKTGRLHQIRRHLKHLSCPLIGDVRYGKGEHNRIFREQHGLHRLALHAHQLRVPHPNGGELAVTAPLPADMAHALESCRAAYAASAANPLLDVVTDR
jgi:tRNA pseudouridine65 synthase